VRNPISETTTQPARNAGSFRVASLPAITLAILRDQNMIENLKIDCIESMTFGINRTAAWREKMGKLYPSDPRNLAAAASLAVLATQTAELTDDAWSQIKPHCGWASETWREAISQVARRVNFSHKIEDFPTFVDCLIGVLRS
jgi:hypothetical protein